MAELSAIQYQALLTIGHAALRADSPHALWQSTAELGLGPLLHADVFALADVDHRVGAGTFGMIRPAWAELSVPSGSQMHRDLLADHPITPHQAGPRSFEVVRVSDLVAPLAWRRTAAYSKMRELISATNQIGITLLAGPRTLAVTYARSNRDFTDHEVDLARRMQPLLQAAERHVRIVAAYWAAVPHAERAVVQDYLDGVGLTKREVAVLAVMAEGHSTSRVAQRLGVSPRTVHKHQQRIYRKLGVTDRLSAVLRAREIGLLNPTP